jgi:cyclase
MVAADPHTPYINRNGLAPDTNCHIHSILPVRLMKTRLPILAAFVALISVAAFRIGAEPETITQIAPGVWFREGDLKSYGHCNNVVIEMKDYLIVVDANFPSGAKAALADIKKVSKKPVKWVFDTHHHGDHAYGNSVWTAAGATTLAYIGVAEEIQRYEPERWRAESQKRKDVGAENRDTLEPPMVTFKTSPHVLDDGNRRVEFHHFGWAHTRGDGFVYLPKEQILATGDAVTNGPYNFVGDANVANWPKVIANAKKLKIKTVLPGHGLPGGPDVLDGEQQFMTQLSEAAKNAASLNSLVTLEDGKPKLVKVKFANSKWVGSSLPTQLAEAYKQAHP